MAELVAKTTENKPRVPLDGTPGSPSKKVIKGEKHYGDDYLSQLRKVRDGASGEGRTAAQKPAYNQGILDGLQVADPL